MSKPEKKRQIIASGQAILIFNNPGEFARFNYSKVLIEGGSVEILSTAEFNLASKRKNILNNRLLLHLLVRQNQGAQ